MARMVPKRLVAGAPRSETRCWNELKKLPDTWTVFSRINYLNTEGEKRRDGEADFILLNPKVGLLFIEVKGSEFDKRDDGWFFKTENGWEKRPDPFEQVRSASHSITKFLKNKIPSLPHIAFGTAVIFTDVEVEDDLGPDAKREIIIDCNEIDKIGERVNEITKNFASKSNFSDQDIKNIEDELVKFYRGKINEKQSINQIDGEILDLSEQQYKILDILSQQKRAVIQGVAGSGKTIIAREYASRQSAQGKRVLLLCFNRLLGIELEKIFSDDENITANNFHSFGTKIAKEAKIDQSEFAGGDARSEEFLQNGISDLIAEAASKLSRSYDALVIDEAQDFRKNWIVGLQCLLEDLEESPIFLFLDPQQRFDVEEWINPFPEEQPYLLNESWRNSHAIARKVQKVFDSELTPSSGIEGSEPEWISTTTDDETVQQIEECLNDLIVNKKIEADQIAILTGNSNLAEVLREKEKFGVTIETIRRFKGLDQAVVILALPVETKSVDKNLAYVGMSRARAKLIVVGPNAKRKAANFGGKP